MFWVVTRDILPWVCIKQVEKYSGPATLYPVYVASMIAIDRVLGSKIFAVFFKTILIFIGFNQLWFFQRYVLLYGVGKARDEARAAVKKLTKEICKLFSKKCSNDIAEGKKITLLIHQRVEPTGWGATVTIWQCCVLSCFSYVLLIPTQLYFLNESLVWHTIKGFHGVKINTSYPSIPFLQFLVLCH